MDKQPNQLDPVVTLADTDVLVIQQTVDNGVKQATIQQLKAAALTGDWTQLSVVPTVSTGYNKGQKEQELTFANINLSTFMSPGQKMKIDRTGTTPTQCTDLESTSSQYATKASPSGIAFTGNFTIEAWIKLESYTGATQFILNRENGTTGWGMYINSNGQAVIYYGSAGNFRNYTSYQSAPLNQWVHVVGVVTSVASGTFVTYMNGSVAPGVVTTGSATSFTQPAVDLRLGAYANSSSLFFDGKLSDVRLWSIDRTATQIRDNMNIQLVGSETNLVAYFKLNGNFNDSTANGNNLTAAGAAAATSVDHPFHTTEYGYVTKVAYSAPNTVVTIFTGTDYNIPNMTLQNPYYSGIDAPYNFPKAAYKWEAAIYARTNTIQSSPTVNQWYNFYKLTVPSGEWVVGYRVPIYATKAANDISVFGTLSTANNTESEQELTDFLLGTTTFGKVARAEKGISLSAQTDYYFNVKVDAASFSNLQVLQASYAVSKIYAKCPYA